MKILGSVKRDLMIPLLGCLFGPLLLVTCVTTSGSLKDREFTKRDTQYRIGDPGKDWRRINIKGADLAWVNGSEDSTILVNSLCKDVGDISLPALTGQLLIGMTDQNIESQSSKTWSGREALETIISVKVDGVLRKLNIFVLKKDGCVYDIVFAAPPDRFDTEVVAYQAIRDQFDVGVRR